MRDKVYKRKFSIKQRKDLALILRDVVIADCTDDELYFIIHILVYGTKIILTDIDLVHEYEQVSEGEHQEIKKQNLIKDIAIYNEKIDPREHRNVQDNLHILKMLLFQPNKIVPNLGGLTQVSNSALHCDQRFVSSEENTEHDSSDSQPEVIWRLYPTVIERILSEFSLDRELIIEACVYVSVLCGRYNIKRTRMVSLYAQELEISAYQLAMIESNVFRRLHEKGIEIQLQNNMSIGELSQKDERSDIISVLGDSIHEDILWRSDDDSEFIVINTEESLTYSDSSSSIMIRRRKPLNGTQSNTNSLQDKKAGNTQDFHPDRTHLDSDLSVLWESDSEIITKLYRGNSLQPMHNFTSKSIQPKDAIQKSSDNETSTSDSEDDETDLFER